MRNIASEFKLVATAMIIMVFLPLAVLEAGHWDSYYSTSADESAYSYLATPSYLEEVEKVENGIETINDSNDDWGWGFGLEFSASSWCSIAWWNKGSALSDSLGPYSWVYYQVGQSFSWEDGTPGSAPGGTVSFDLYASGSVSTRAAWVADGDADGSADGSAYSGAEVNVSDDNNGGDSAWAPSECWGSFSTSGPNDVGYDFDPYPTGEGSIVGTPTESSSSTGFDVAFSWGYSYSGSFGISTGMAQFGTNGDAACTADASITFNAGAGEDGEIECETQSSLSASGGASFSSD